MNELKSEHIITDTESGKQLKAEIEIYHNEGHQIQVTLGDPNSTRPEGYYIHAAFTVDFFNGKLQIVVDDVRGGEITGGDPQQLIELVTFPEAIS